MLESLHIIVYNKNKCKIAQYNASIKLEMNENVNKQSYFFYLFRHVLYKFGKKSHHIRYGLQKQLMSSHVSHFQRPMQYF